ncbi:MAG: site-2 protease family protein [Clostridia bacterium]|nr:site-2 protease family protein [Clostridia bacterium]
MLFDLFSEDFDMLDLIIKLFSRLFVVFCTMPIHEYAHALIATKLGDQTPRLAGRLTLNPMAHISPMGAIMIFLFGFGYAKPVSVNPRNFKDSKKGMALTAIAGPISNLIMGFIFIVLAVVFANLSHAETILYNAIFSFLLFAGTINVNLAVFNLLPIPPLDGSRILQLLIPAKYYYKFLEYERYIVILVFILIATGVLSGPLSAISYFIIDLFVDIASLPF